MCNIIQLQINSLNNNATKKIDILQMINSKFLYKAENKLFPQLLRKKNKTLKNDLSNKEENHPLDKFMTSEIPLSPPNDSSPCFHYLIPVWATLKKMSQPPTTNTTSSSQIHYVSRLFCESVVGALHRSPAHSP